MARSSPFQYAASRSASALALAASSTFLVWGREGWSEFSPGHAASQRQVSRNETVPKKSRGTRGIPGAPWGRREIFEIRTKPEITARRDLKHTSIWASYSAFRGTRKSKVGTGAERALLGPPF